MLRLLCDSRSLECVTKRRLAQRRTPICAQYMISFMGVFQKQSLWSTINRADLDLHQSFLNS